MLLPKPYTPGGPPFIIGGDSDPAMRRAATIGDGWYSWWKGYEIEPHLEKFRGVMEKHNRSFDGYHLKIGSPHRGEPPETLIKKVETVKKLGAEEFVIAVPVEPKTMERDLRFWAEAAGIKN